MHIKDHNDAMTFFRNSRQLESNGKWKEFVDEMEFESMIQKPRAMAQEPRIGLAGGQLVQPGVEGVRQGYSDKRPIHHMTKKLSKKRVKFLDEATKTVTKKKYKKWQNVPAKERSLKLKIADTATRRQKKIPLASSRKGAKLSEEAIKKIEKSHWARRGPDDPIYKKMAKLASERRTTTPDVMFQKKLWTELEKGSTTVEKLAKKFETTPKEIKRIANKLLRNIYTKNVAMGKGKPESIAEWIPADDVRIDKVLENVANTPKLAKLQGENIGRLFYDAFGREKLANGMDNPTFNTRKYTAVLKNLDEYNRVYEVLKKQFPNLKLNLDHPLSKQALRNLNVSADELVRVTPIPEKFNKGFKKQLTTKYANAIVSKNLTQKKAIDKIAKDLGINIGRVSDDFTKHYHGVKQFQNLDIKKAIVENLEAQQATAEKFKGYHKQNKTLFEEAGFKSKILKSKIDAIPPKQMEGIKKLLQTAKTAKGPAKFKAMQTIITTVGIGAAASLFDKFGIQPAMADTGVAAPGVTAGDIGLGALATAVPEKGRKLWGKALSGASKILSTTPGFLGLEAFIGPGFVSSAGGSFGEAIASPFLLEGTMRDKRIYDQLKKEGYSEDQIQVVKDSVMLRADVGDTGLHTSMIPLQEIEYKGKKFTAGDTELADISSIYDKAAGVIAEEDEARLERADKFDYLQDIGFAGGGLANLTRTVAPDSEGIMSLKKKR